MPTLTVTKTYADNTVLTEAMLDAMKTSIETFFNSTQIDDDNIQNGGISLVKLSTDITTGLCPTGSMVDYGGATAPSGWLLCDGSYVSTTTYAALNTVLAGAYNDGGEPGGTFRLPDLRGRVGVGMDSMDNGVGTGGGKASRLTSMSGDEDVLGETSGVDTQDITTAQLAAHTHTNNDASHTHSFTANANFGTSTHTHASGELYACFVINPANVNKLRQSETGTSWGSTHQNNVGTGFPSTTETGGLETVGTTAGPTGTAAPTGTTDPTDFTSDSTGSGNDHNNLQPLQIVNKIIKT